MNAHRRRKVAVIALVLCVIYVSSYLVLSRRGFAQADEWGFKSFYFVFPSSPAAWDVNWCLVVVYYPLIVIDNMLGTGRGVGSEPMYRLSVSGQAGLPGKMGANNRPFDVLRDACVPGVLGQSVFGSKAAPNRIVGQACIQHDTVWRTQPAVMSG